MAYFQRVWAQIDGRGNVVNRIIADDYETANVVTRDIIGQDAIAVEINNWRVGIGDKYINNVFYDQNGNECEYIPDVEDSVDMLKNENQVYKTALSYIAPTFTDEQAVTVKQLYPDFESVVSKSLSAGDRVLYDGYLCKATEDIDTVSEDDPPFTIQESTISLMNTNDVSDEDQFQMIPNSKYEILG